MNTSLTNSSLPLNRSSSGSILPHWYPHTACEESLGDISFDFIVKVINLMVGYPANIMVMWLVARKKSDSSTSDIFIFNLAIADACYCVIAPIDIVGDQILEITYYMWNFQSFAFGIKDTTPLFLTCICLDRYMAVVHPIVFTSMRDNKIRMVVSILVWGLMLAFALSKALGLDSTPNVFSGLILAAFAIMIFCNISIMWTLRKSVFGKEKMHPMKKKALRTVLIALAIIVFNYLPIVAVLPIALYYNFPKFCQVELIAFALMDISSSIEPLIYISKMEQLPCFNSLPCICCRSPSTEPHNGST